MYINKIPPYKSYSTTKPYLTKTTFGRPFELEDIYDDQIIVGDIVRIGKVIKGQASDDFKTKRDGVKATIGLIDSPVKHAVAASAAVAATGVAGPTAGDAIYTIICLKWNQTRNSLVNKHYKDDPHDK